MASLPPPDFPLRSLTDFERWLTIFEISSSRTLESAQRIRTEVRASLDKLGDLLPKAQADWTNHVRRVEAEAALVPTTPQITATTSLVQDLEVLRAKCDSANTRRQALRSRGETRLADVVLNKLIAARAQRRTSTETESWDLKRTLAAVEEHLSQSMLALAEKESWRSMAMRVLAAQYDNVMDFECGMLNQEWEQRQAALVEAKQRAAAARTNAATAVETEELDKVDKALSEKGRMLELTRVVLQTRLQRRDRDVLLLLFLAGNVGIYMARQRILEEFFERP